MKRERGAEGTGREKGWRAGVKKGQKKRGKRNGSERKGAAVNGFK